MLSSSITCPICGAKVQNVRSTEHFTCHFCNFERRTAVGTKIISSTELENLPQLIKLKNISTLYFEGEQSIPEETPSVKIMRLNKEHQNIDAIWSPMTLPFQEDLNAYLQEKFRQLAFGGLLYLSTPVKYFWQDPAPLPGQINFFKAKNIMFLLEQHGFKMAWRQNRFASILRIIARKG